MRFNVADLLKATTGETRLRDLDDDLAFEEDGVTLLAPVRGDLVFTREPAGILAQGRLRTVARMSCARCLSDVDVPVVFDFEEEYRPTIHIPGGPLVLPADEREAATDIDEHHVLDVTEALRQNLAVVLPLHPLCRDDCRGLCPRCGADLNAGPCGCAPEVDSRWADLRQYIEETDAS